MTENKHILQYFRNPDRRISIAFTSNEQHIIVANIMGVVTYKPVIDSGFMSFSTGRYEVSQRGYGCYHYDTVLKFEEFMFVVSDVSIDVDKIIRG